MNDELLRIYRQAGILSNSGASGTDVAELLSENNIMEIRAGVSAITSPDSMYTTNDYFRDKILSFLGMKRSNKRR